MLKLRKNKKGFTLVELIVVIAIMAVLAGTIAGVTVSQLNKQTNKSAKNELEGLLNDFKSFMIDYKVGTDGTLTEAVTKFAEDAAKTKGKAVFDNTKDPVAGEHVFKYTVDETNKKVTFSCKEKGGGASAATISVVYTYADILS